MSRLDLRCHVLVILCAGACSLCWGQAAGLRACFPEDASARLLSGLLENGPPMITVGGGSEAVGDWRAGTGGAAWVSPSTGLVFSRSFARPAGSRFAVVRYSVRNQGSAALRLAELPAAELRFRLAERVVLPSYAPLQYRDETWYGSTFWSGPDWTRVGRDWHHPGQQTPSVRTFTAPTSGAVSLFGRAYKADTNNGGGDGVRLVIRHGHRTIWQCEIDGDDATGVEPTLSVQVRAGDRLRFIVHKRGDIPFDTTHWDPVVQYVDGPRYVASEAFSAQSAAGNPWSYEMETQPDRVTPLPAVHGLDESFGLLHGAPTVGAPVTVSGRDVPALIIADASGEGGIVVAAAGPMQRMETAVGEGGEMTLRVTAWPRRLEAGKRADLPPVLVAPYQGAWTEGATLLRRELAARPQSREAAALCGQIARRFRAETTGRPSSEVARMLAAANLMVPASALPCRLGPTDPLPLLASAWLPQDIRTTAAAVEMARVREDLAPALDGDYRRITPVPSGDGSWDIAQFLSADGASGLILATREADAPPEAGFVLSGLAPGGAYRLLELPSGEVGMRSGQELMTEGLQLALGPGTSRAIGLERTHESLSEVPEPPRHFRVEAAGAGALRLTWEPVASAAGYVLWRDGDVIARVEGSERYLDNGLEAGRTVRYSIAAERGFRRSAQVDAIGTTPDDDGVVRPARRPDANLWDMVEKDWRAQDGLDGSPDALRRATEATLQRAAQLLEVLGEEAAPGVLAAERTRLTDLRRCSPAGAAGWRSLYLRAHWLKREIALGNPLMDFGPLLLCKRVPPAYSHLVMQYFGWRARPGGGLFVLDRPGYSSEVRDITGGRLAVGCVLEPRLSYDGRRIVFSYSSCTDSDPFYHIWEVNVDGSGLHQLTSGPYEDVMPTYLPDGGIAFCSTRRGGHARCFGAQFGERWHVYTLHRMDADGSGIKTLSYHDTNEWFPAVSSTGEILFSRWDYIDRNAVLHQNLWATHPDGTNAVARWGNHTQAPHCTFQLQPVPDSGKVVFTASAHHSITGGSIAIVDPYRGVDGEPSLERITPQVPFPEAEGTQIGEYYEAPWPLSEDFFLVAYSRSPLIFEPGPNDPAALGLYLLDRYGNRELLYRDPQISATNPTPLRARTAPPVLESGLPEDGDDSGTFVLNDVYRGLSGVARGAIRDIRVVQILPKTTPVADSPPVGLAGEENARAILGTVPVEHDGSAHFRAPARRPLLFQALDGDGLAIQTMRATAYLQPGEVHSCVGCHENRLSAPANAPVAALRRRASDISPGPEGSCPLSYPLLVQPVWDRHCIRCHSGDSPAKGMDLTGVAQDGFSRSYRSLCGTRELFWGEGTNPRNAAEALVPRYGGRNVEYTTQPGGLYGSPGCRLIRMLRDGHHGVKLSGDEIGRVASWVDANATFYGVYDPQEQARQLRGEAVPMPSVQ